MKQNYPISSSGKTYIYKNTVSQLAMIKSVRFFCPDVSNVSCNKSV